MKHSSKNAIPTRPQKQPSIAQNFHIKKSPGKKNEEEVKEEEEEGAGENES